MQSRAAAARRPRLLRAAAGATQPRDDGEKAPAGKRARGDVTLPSEDDGVASPSPAAVAPSVRLVPHAHAPLEGDGRARVLTAQPVLPVSDADVCELERNVRECGKRPAEPGEPPLYAWVRQGRALQPCWALQKAGAAASAAVMRLLDFTDASAREGARALGIRLDHSKSVIVNVWDPGAREQAQHDDGQRILTVLLLLRSAPGWRLEFDGASDKWHAALGAGDTLLVFALHVAHRIMRGEERAAFARVTFVALYATVAG